MTTVNSFGTLYIVATPLGNLEDITFRAVETLRKADLVAAEDTRHSMKLLTHYGIETKLISCHDHNERKRAPQLIDHLKSGQTIALISDAGTPTISDPGYNFVSMAAKEGITIIPIPGCSAAIAGLSVSGLPTDSFYFKGFLPKKQGQLVQALNELKSLPATLIFYESPRRIKKLIEQAIETLGDREACLAREISKIYEEYLRGSLSDILKQLEQKDSIKGEIALFIQGCTEEKSISSEQLKALVVDKLTNCDLGTSALAKEISAEYKISKKTVYDLILSVKNSPKK